MSADEISTIFLVNLDSYLQNSIIGGQVEIVLNAQKLTFAERHGFP
jgi:hypothetical protein